MKHFLAFLFGVVLCVASSTAQACTCLEATLSDRWRNADIIFSGTVESISTIRKYMKDNITDTPIEVFLNVSEVFKGKIKSKNKGFVLHTSQQKYNCAGHPFEVGQSYLVFAYLRRAETFEHWSLYNYPSGTYGIGGGCGGTKPLESKKAQEEILTLREN